jgi:hypothetical protein
MVMVFDEGGEQIPGYQGQYKRVMENILIDAPLGALFMHGFAHTGGWREIPREEW